MSTNSQFLNGQFSEAQIEQLIQSLRGMRPVSVGYFTLDPD
jgi:hypothetical protein